MFEDEAVRCWGSGVKGALGLGRPTGTGGASLAEQDLVLDFGGANVTSLAAGAEFSCAILDDADLVCWGANNSSQLGYSCTEGCEIGNEALETPARIRGFSSLLPAQ